MTSLYQTIPKIDFSGTKKEGPTYSGGGVVRLDFVLVGLVDEHVDQVLQFFFVDEDGRKDHVHPSRGQLESP